jgi:hypothetical protein
LQIENFNWEQRIYESDIFSFGDFCWRLSFGCSSDSINSEYGFLLTLLYAEAERLEVNVEFKMHHPYDFPLVRARPQPYSYGQGAIRQRGLFRFVVSFVIL